MRRPDRRLAAIGMALAGTVLATASCASHPAATPTPTETGTGNPVATSAPAGTVPQLRQLGSPIVLKAMLGQAPSSAGGCSAGFVTLSGPGAGPGQCYRQIGSPVTITSAAVSLVQPTSSSGQAPGLLITVPPADRAELAAITSKAYESQGFVDISVAGKAWAVPEAMAPLTGGQFSIQLQNSNQALQLQGILIPSS